MTEQTTPSIIEVHAARVARAADLKSRVLAAIAVPETTVPAAIAARLMVGSYLLVKALNETVLILRKVNGDEVRLPMMLEMMLSGTSHETLKVAAPRYIELVGSTADRLLDAAEARLNGEPVTGEEPDIAVLSDLRSLGYQLASVVNQLAESDPTVGDTTLLAGMIATDVADLANSADSCDSAANEDEFAMALSGGSSNREADELRAVIKDLPVEMLIAQVMTPFHTVIVPVIVDLEKIVASVLPDNVKSAVANSDVKFTSFDDALDAAFEQELARDPELAAALKEGIPVDQAEVAAALKMLDETVPTAADAEANSGSPAAADETDGADDSKNS